jgi:hypothetical protein
VECPRCHHPNPIGTDRCGKCATDLEQARARAEAGFFKLFIRAVVEAFIMLPLAVLVLLLILLPLLPYLSFLSSRGYISPLDKLLTYPSTYAVILAFLVVFVVAVFADSYDQSDPRDTLWLSIRKEAPRWLQVQEAIWMMISVVIWGFFATAGIVLEGRPLATYSDWDYWWVIILRPVLFSAVVGHLWGKLEWRWWLRRYHDQYESSFEWAQPKRTSPRQIGRWQKMSLSEKLVLVTLGTIFAFLAWWVIRSYPTLSGMDLGVGLRRFFVTILIIYAVVLFTHFYPRWQTEKDLQQKLAQDKTLAGAVLSSRIEYLSGHLRLPKPQTVDLWLLPTWMSPFMSPTFSAKPQTVDLWLLPTELIIETAEGRPTIPLSQISNIEVKGEMRTSGVAPAGCLLGLFMRDVPTGLMTRVDKFLEVTYIDKTIMQNRVVFGYIVPPHTHEEWANRLNSARYTLLTGDSLQT